MLLTFIMTVIDDQMTDLNPGIALLMRFYSQTATKTMLRLHIDILMILKRSEYSVPAVKIGYSRIPVGPLNHKSMI